MTTDKLPPRLRSLIDTDGPGGCWLWLGYKTGNGNVYGGLKYGGRYRRAHRVVYELLAGPIPDGLELDHLCRVRHCVNPAHLEPVDHRTNVLRGNAYAAQNARKTHCKYGHPLTGANLYIRSDGRKAGNRECRACADRRRQEYVDRKAVLA